MAIGVGRQAGAEQFGDGNGGKCRRQATGQQAGNHWQQHGFDPLELRIERNRQRHGGRAKQKVHKLGAVKIGLVAGPGQHQ
jgi:hypothetical protein